MLKLLILKNQRRAKEEESKMKKKEVIGQNSVWCMYSRLGARGQALLGFTGMFPWVMNERYSPWRQTISSWYLQTNDP